MVPGFVTRAFAAWCGSHKTQRTVAYPEWQSNTLEGSRIPSVANIQREVTYLQCQSNIQRDITYLQWQSNIQKAVTYPQWQSNSQEGSHTPTVAAKPGKLLNEQYLSCKNCRYHYIKA